MPMPHRTFAQVAKRRLVGKEGKERIREVRALISELPDYKNGPYADLRKSLLAEIEDTRVRSSAVHRDSIAVRREGAAQISAGRPAERGQVVHPAGPVGDPDQDRRLPVHHAAPGPCPDSDQGRARPAGGDPRPDRRRFRRPRWWSSPVGRASFGGRDRLLRASLIPVRRAGDRPRGAGLGRDRQAGDPRGHASRRGNRCRGRPTASSLPRPRDGARVDPRSGDAGQPARCDLEHDRPDPHLPAKQRLDRCRASRAAGRRDGCRRRGVGAQRPRFDVHRRAGSGVHRRGSTASASVASTSSQDTDVVEVLT